jgi:hypothetical protein
MSNALPLGLDAVDLLLTIAETPAMAISGVALRDFHAKAGAALIAVGALKPDGFEPVAVSQADHDDASVSANWTGELGGYAYFSPNMGLVRVDGDALRRYRLDISWVLRWISMQLGLGSSARQVCLIPDRLWDLGDVWLGERNRIRRKAAIFVARRLNDLETVRQVAEMLHMHLARPSRVILTTTLDPRLARDLTADSYTILPIKDCARAGIEDFTLDTAIVYSAAHSLRASRTASPIQADAEFRIVRVGDREFRFQGDKQRQVIGLLHKRWENGEGGISTVIMFEELGWTSSKRLRDLFKGHPDWKDLIGYEGGACWLRYDELLAGSPSALD